MFKEVSLVYFSSTKTTQRTVRAIGRALAKAFDIPVQEYDFTLPNARSRKLHFTSDQLVIVGSPVYGGVMPLLVREYLAQYVTGEKSACVLAAIYGNRNFDDCLVEMQDLMEENGFVVTAAAACIGEHSYSTAIASGRPNAQDLALAEEFGKQVAQKLSASPTVPTLAQTLPGSRPYRERKPSAPMAPQTTNGCIRCGMCVNNCPVGAIDRNDDVLYICYDNEAYMNTGIQRSSSTPHFADTTTTPQGTVIPGKMQQKKNLTKIMVAHGIPYVAQTTFIGNFKDITEKAHKAIYTPGAAFLNVMAPCPRGWRYPSEKLMEVTKMAVETCVWPLYEVVEGKYILSYKPKEKKPVEEYLKMQGRFAHMFKPGNEWMIEEVQKEVDKNWEELLKLCEL